MRERERNREGDKGKRGNGENVLVFIVYRDAKS